MEVDYKAAKEAFHSDNPGESIWSIQITSLTALTAYVLYAVLAKRSTSQRPFLDYTTTIFPLLLGVTALHRHPYLLNGLILSISTILHVLRPVPTTKKEPTTKRSQGKWLEESDSDEEPAQPVQGASTSIALSRLSTSSSTDRTPSRPLSPIDPSSAPLPSPGALSPDRLEKPEMTKRSKRRRHSPTPSTHTHMAIDVLPTPENNAFAIQPNPAYPPHPRVRNGEASVGGSKERLPFLTVYRAHMMVMTIHCILAVDFPMFPRHQGKCEVFGTSLMDVGVGSFVFSLGLVTSRSAGSRGTSTSLAWSIFKALKKASPVLLLGLVRVLMVKGSEYPEHVTEYGVHWNFFFTLGLLPVLGILLSPLSKTIGWTPLALLVGLIHEIALKQLGLQSWIMSPDRVGLISMNKEGIVSMSGYFAIYGLGLGIGQHILRSAADNQNKDSAQSSTGHTADHTRMRMEKRRTECALELFGYSVGWWVLLVALRLSGQQVSRRMANLPYVLWTVAYNTTFLLGYLIIEIAFFPVSLSPADTPAVPPLLDAINKNGLAVFLLANLGTGLVNVSMKTMYASDTVALGVLVAYSGGISALAWAGRGFRLKV